MTASTFDDILQKRLNSIASVLGAKAKEYASDYDRLHNFKRTAKILDCSPERALIGFFVKHLVSLLDIVDAIDPPEEPLKPEVVNEKIGDAVNYLILLEGLLIERINNQLAMASIHSK